MRPPGVNGMDAEYRMQVVSRALLFYAHFIKCLCVCERQEWPLFEAVRLPDVAGYKRLPGLKRRLKLLAYTNVRDKISVIETSCFTCNGSFSRHHQLTFGILSPCHHLLHLQVVVWVLVTIVQTLPLWQNLKFFQLEGKGLCLSLQHHSSPFINMCAST